MNRSERDINRVGVVARGAVGQPAIVSWDWRVDGWAVLSRGVQKRREREKRTSRSRLIAVDAPTKDRSGAFARQILAHIATRFFNARTLLRSIDPQYRLSDRCRSTNRLGRSVVVCAGRRPPDNSDSRPQRLAAALATPSVTSVVYPLSSPPPPPPLPQHRCQLFVVAVVALSPHLLLLLLLLPLIRRRSPTEAEAA